MQAYSHEFSKSRFIDLLSRLCSIPGKTFFENKRTNEIVAFLNSVSDSLSPDNKPNNKIIHNIDKAGNLIVSLGQGEWADAVVFDSHIDVVGKGFSEPILKDDGRIYGLGTGDNLTSATLLCLLAEKLASENIKFKRPLYLLFSVCEEGYGNLKGVRQFVDDKKTPPYLFVSFDLSFKEYSTSGLGSRRYKVTAKGPGGHSWDNRDAPSAIEHIVEFLTILKFRQKSLKEKYSDPFSFNIGIIEGGEGVNIIAGNAAVHFEFRSTSEALLDKMGIIVKEEIERGNNSGKNILLNFSIKGERPAAKPVRPEIGEKLLQKIWKKYNVPSKLTTRSTNINYPLFMGWPCICTGLCECAGYHTEDEYIILNSVEKGWKLLEEITKELVLTEDAPGA